MPTCRLCGQDRKLIDAHIIPRQFYPPPSPIGDTMIFPGLEGGYPKRTPIGIYDQHILCAECDGRLGVLDQHVIERVLRGRFRCLQMGVAREYVDADAETVLRFAASVAWRAAVSSHDTFKTMKIGPYVDVLHSWISGATNEIPVAGWLAEFETDAVPMLNPALHDFSGVQVAVIYASRLIFYLKLDEKPVPADFELLQLKPGRPVHSIVREFRKGKEAPLILKMLEQPSVQPLRKKWETRRLKGK